MYAAMALQTFVRVRIVVAIATLVIVAGCSSLQRKPLHWDEARTLSAAEIQEEFGGNTLMSIILTEGVYARGTTSFEYFATGGVVRASIYSEDYTGTWKTDGDKLCIQYAKRTDVSGCWQVRIIDNLPSPSVYLVDSVGFIVNSHEETILIGGNPT